MFAVRRLDVLQGPISSNAKALADAASSSIGQAQRLSAKHKAPKQDLSMRTRENSLAPY